MYSNKSIGVVTNTRNNRRVKNKNVPRSARYSNPSNCTNIRLEKIKNNEDLSGQRGMKSVGEKAIEQGLFDIITEYLSEYFYSHDGVYTKSDLGRDLQKNFPSIFSYSKCPINTVRTMDRVPEWSEALIDADYHDLKMAALKTLHNRAKKEAIEYEDDNGVYRIRGMSDADKIRYINLLNDLEDRHTLSEKDKLWMENIKMKNELMRAQIEQLKAGGNDNKDNNVVFDFGDKESWTGGDEPCILN